MLQDDSGRLFKNNVKLPKSRIFTAKTCRFSMHTIVYSAKSEPITDHSIFLTNQSKTNSM